MIFYPRLKNFICYSLALISLNILYPTFAVAITLDNAYKTGHPDFQSSTGFQPRNEMSQVFHPSMHPNLNDKINEAHPIPDYIKKFSKDKGFPTYYQQLLEVDPKDQVQSKVFNDKAFRSIRRIVILNFENKTSGPFKDANAGNMIAKQVARELQLSNKYLIFPPLIANNEDAKLTIVKQPQKNSLDLEKLPNISTQAIIQEPLNSKNKMDAVMIGAVTKYMDSYLTRNGTIERSLSSSVELGAFLVSTRTGEVIWGARFIGSQPTGLSSFLTNSGSTWLSKEQLSKTAMKNILKEFHKNPLKY